MSENRFRDRDGEARRRKWDERAATYDGYYETFRGAVEQYVDWELLKGHLPQDRNARILDAAGGTGRMTLPLAKMGYPVTLCDFSPGMLEVARRKLRGEGLLDRAEILECDVSELCFADMSFDFVLCWNGMLEAAREIVRVTKRGGRISVCLANRCREAIELFPQDPASALALIESRSDYVWDGGERYRAVSSAEARELFAAQGIEILDTYAACGWLDVLHISPELRESRQWDEGFFDQVAQMVLRLSRESSVKGMAGHLVLYGERA